jgi:hypothetical protein
MSYNQACPRDPRDPRGSRPFCSNSKLGLTQGAMDNKKQELKNAGRKQKRMPPDLCSHCPTVSWKPCSTQSK